jgi:hypothetical protein
MWTLCLYYVTFLVSLNCTCIICIELLWLIPHPIVIWLTYGSMECNEDVWCMYVTKLLKVHWHRWYVNIIFHEFPQWKVHGCQIPWPPRSPNLTPMDFSFWGFVKYNVYVPPMPVDLQQLRDRIVNAIALVHVTFLGKMWVELEYRLVVCRIILNICKRTWSVKSAL